MASGAGTDHLAGAVMSRQETGSCAALQERFRIPRADLASYTGVAGNTDVRFTIQPDLSGKNDFVVRASW